MGFVTAALQTIGMTILNVLPVLAFLFAFQLLVIRQPLPELRQILIGALFVIAGLGMFLLGLEQEEIEPVIVHKENYKIRPLYQDEAIMDLEMSERDFLVFKNAATDRLAIVFKRKDGDYGMIEPNVE